MADHAFDFDGVRILEQESNLNKRLILESLQTLTNEHTCNWRVDTNNISRLHTSAIEKWNDPHVVNDRTANERDMT